MADPHLLPQYQHELLAAIDPADGVVLMEPSPEERQAGYGLIVGVKRYDPEPHLALRLPLRRDAIACGVYVRGDALWKARVLSPASEPSTLSVTFVLKEPARVSIYTEGGDRTRDDVVRQVVIVAEASAQRLSS
jgi:hypothetical protein